MNSRKTNESRKITLTLGQLRRVVEEYDPSEDFPDFVVRRYNNPSISDVTKKLNESKNDFAPYINEILKNVNNLYELWYDGEEEELESARSSVRKAIKTVKEKFERFIKLAELAISREVD